MPGKVGTKKMKKIQEKAEKKAQREVGGVFCGWPRPSSGSWEWYLATVCSQP